MKAKSVSVCIFTNEPPNAAGSYSVDLLPSMERTLYNSVSAAASDLAVQGYEGTTLSVCNAKSPAFTQFLATNTTSIPFIAIAGTFPDGSMKYYATRNANQVKNLLKAMWVGEFGGSGNTPNPGDGNGGWGDGEALICKILPPLCALSFLPWLALTAYTTYRAAESKSTTGRLIWAAPAVLFWQGFVAKGGIQQIQWWVKKAGIGGIGKKSGIKLKLISGYHATQTERKAIAYMIENGLTDGCTSKNKCFKILEQTDDFVKVKVSTKAVWTIGDSAKWDHDTMSFEIN